MKARTTSSCPICSAEIAFDWETKEIPHFGEAMIIAGVCDGCGFKLSDTILLSQGEPARYSITIEDANDLNARVIRSTSGTIRLPELGVDVEPGPASEAYISNLEGVLQRVRDIVLFATRSARNAGVEENARRGELILERIERAMEGTGPLTVILEDPLGNSAIVSEKAVTTKLTPEECDGLETGMIILDSSA
ncbi:ZPR1 zinc finger domain-containing protein [Candidatus Methanocrinis natronophilus]|uniref:ZPR1 zinc finger domain-containing protein n=1 Tax=Candidatus Methanocrinis natronophilus TaxID=3033396 RepID=A0ABT5X8C5_9EURY|nr:ZPR1 zinc finger domain-containing protein [Candidatus Methanocrinis natronophilus]MDF0590832.1 ZPR1 zinc finger domain-containing protein [Candidatus Methanocrinis natronophilus]